MVRLKDLKQGQLPRGYTQTYGIDYETKSTNGYSTSKTGSCNMEKYQLQLARNIATAEYRVIDQEICDLIWFERLLEELKISTELAEAAY